MHIARVLTVPGPLCANNLFKNQSNSSKILLRTSRYLGSGSWCC